MLPSPTWPKVAISSPVRAAIASMRASSSATRPRGTPTSSSSVPPRRSSAVKHRRRTSISISPSTSSSAATTRLAPASSQQRAATAISSLRPVPGRSDCTSRRAADSRSRSSRRQSSTAASVTRSMSSSSDGVMPARLIACTASPAATRVGKFAARVSGGAGSGRRRRVASATTPSVPSEPTSSDSRSSPATRFTVGPPSSTRSPSASTTVTPSTLSRVAPYLTQHRPPALVAMLPPMVEKSRLAGSGAYQRPCSAAAAFSAPLSTPASTRATRLAGSISRMRVISSVESTMPPSIAAAPPESPVPAPRGTTGTPWAAATRIAAWTSAVWRGRTTASGRPPDTSSAWSWR